MPSRATAASGRVRGAGGPFDILGGHATRRAGRGLEHRASARGGRPPGARPLPAYSHKADLRLADHLDDDDRLSERGGALLHDFVDEALRVAEDRDVEDLVAFATSAVRDAANGDEVPERVRTGRRIDIRALSGEEEARLTFLAVRRWFGWSSGRPLVVDIGGGSLEISSGLDEEPDVAFSLPLGAVRLTRDWFTGDPPPPELEICPWALREGVILRRLDGLTA